MKDNHHNPYSAPKTDTVTSEATASKPERRASVLLWLLLCVFCAFAAFCLFCFAAAVYELVNLKDGDYGQHTPKFRYSYLRSGTTALLLAVGSGYFVFRLRRRIRSRS